MVSAMLLSGIIYSGTLLRIAKVHNILTTIRSLEKSYEMFKIRYDAVLGDGTAHYFNIDRFQSQCNYKDHNNNGLTFTIGTAGNGIIDVDDIAAKRNQIDTHFAMSSAMCHLQLSGLMPLDYEDRPTVYVSRKAFIAANGIDGIQVFTKDKVFFSLRNNKNDLFIVSGVAKDALGEPMYDATISEDVLSFLKGKMKMTIAGTATARRAKLMSVRVAYELN